MTPPKNRVRKGAAAIGGFLLEWLLYGLLAIAATRPLMDSWTTAIPQGTENSATVPLFNLWTMRWNIDRLEARLNGYWDAPIFQPANNTFAFSEPQPLMMGMAPVLWCGGSWAAAFNLYLWLGISLAGVFANRLVYRMTNSAFAAWFGGAMLVLLPYTHWMLGLIQLVPMFGVVGTIYALTTFGESPSVGRSFLLGTAFAFTYWLCNYHGLFLSLLLLLSGVWLLGRNLFKLGTWIKLLPGAAWCMLLIGPMIYQQRQVAAERQWERPADLIRTQSAEWGDFTATPWPQLLPIPELVDPHRKGWMLSPGYLKMGLAVIGVCFGLCVSRLRWLTVFLMQFTLLALVFAMGLKFQLGEWTPYDWIRQHYPGLKLARNVFRFVVFAQVGIVLLASLGLAGLWRGLLKGAKSVSDQSALPRRLSLVLTIGFLAVIEVWPDPQTLVELPNLKMNQAWITWIKTNTPPDAVLACVPFPKAVNAPDFHQTTLWMNFGLDHQRPLVNGYSGFFPNRYWDLQEAMANFPDEQSLTLLEENGTQYCVVDRTALSRSEIEQHPTASKKLVWQFSDDRARVDIYRLGIKGQGE